jgi:hypothetical protein
MTRTFRPLEERHSTRVVVVTFDGISPFHLAVPCVLISTQSRPGISIHI